MQGVNGVFQIKVVDQGVQRILHITCTWLKMVATHYTNKNLTRPETQIHKSAATHFPNFSTVHRGTVHHGIVHPMTDTTCVETEKVEVLIVKVDENEMLRDEEGHPRNSA